ncbi:MAG: isoleucine--tRNA ligase, partial [Gammaproteobacteria bacterium]|nr:isoleucine--tRNA ligase [Gammaproteobacteria bacterium]
KPVHWCLDCGSALAEAEVEYQDKTSAAIDVAFRAVDKAAIFKKFNAEINSNDVAVVIWTTTPWTLPANMAVCLHPDFEYVLVKAKLASGEINLVLAEALHKSALDRYGADEYTVLGRCKGTALENLPLQHPFNDRQVPLIVGDHVTTETGTGAVHTAPGHGQDDFVIGQKYGLEVYNPVGGDGVFLADTPLFAGQHVNKANDAIVETLKNNNALLKYKSIRHSYPHCWRHKTPIIFRATPQWFISMEQNKLRTHALKAINNTQWMPDWGQARIESMVVNRPDWCISRQRTWGVPITLFVHKQTGELHPRTSELIEKVAGGIEKQGIDFWFSLEPEQLLGSDADQYDKVTDTLDVWFDSGVTHAAVLEQRKDLHYPADLYLEGSDQHRGWFQSSLLTSVAMNGVAPYKAVLTHGFTVDADGKKMSKSQGNVIAPQKVCDSLGADILRLWVASTDYSGEMSVSDEILKRMSDSYRRIRNTARFLLANLNGFEPSRDMIAADKMLPLDRWAVATTWHLQQNIITAYREYNFHSIYQKLHNFCAVELGSFYLDIIKDRQYTTQMNSLARRSAQTALYHIIEAMTRWLAPICSFTADEIWQAIPGDRNQSSVFISTWYEDLHDLPAEGRMNFDFWNTVLQVRTLVSKHLEDLRVAGSIGSSLDAEVDLYCDDALLKTLATLEDELRFVLITSYVRLHPLTSSSPGTEQQIDTRHKIRIITSASKHNKCIRCWHYREDVGQHSEHPELCGRCVSNVSGSGEVRKHA